jgi:hypothetical protein
MATLELDIEHAVHTPEPLMAVRAEIVRLLEAGYSRELIYDQLEGLRYHFRAEGREREEDLVEDAMDLFNGWTRSALQV